MPISVKLFYESEIRRVAIGDENGDVTFGHLEQAIATIFPTVVGKVMKISWKDEDEDIITITTTPELQEAVRTQTKNFGVVKFQVEVVGTKDARISSVPEVASVPRVTVADDSEASAVHTGVACNECSVCPIVGPRYKCTVRYDFDLCSACEAKKSQPHPMIKITKPHGRTTVVKDDDDQTSSFGGALPNPSPFGCPWGFGRRGGFVPPPPPPPPAGPGAGGVPPPPPAHFGGHPFGLPPHGGPWGPHGWHGRGGGRDRMSHPWGGRGAHGPFPFPPATPPTAEVPGVEEKLPEAVTNPVDDVVEHTDISCNECGVFPIVGPRYKCTVRKNYDLCSICEANHRTKLGNLGAPTGAEMCPMLKINHPDQAPVDDSFVYSFAKHHHALLYKDLYRGSKHGGVVTLPEAVHRFIRCDGCGVRPITGVRFKCTVRPDFDLCETCEATKPQPYPMVKIYRARHRPAYIVYHPRDPLASARYAARVKAFANVNETGTPAAAEPAPAAASGSASSATAPKPEVAAVVHHRVTCDECGMSPIIGVRYKCTKRPNFDLCGGCEAKRTVQPYPMIMMTSHQGNLRSLRMDFANKQAGATLDVTSGVEPVIITQDNVADETPASAGNSSSTAPRNTAERPILIQVHHGITCDVCGQAPITGPRFKCTLREDFDMCSACEAKKRGESTAPLVKIYDPSHHPSVLVVVFDEPWNGPRQRGPGPRGGILAAGGRGGHCGRGGGWRARAWEEAMNVAAAAASSAPPFLPTTTSAAQNLPKPALRFVRDVTLPDGTDVVGGATNLQKVWLVRNDGQYQWPEGCRLVFAGGDALHVADPPAEGTNTPAETASVPQIAMRNPPLLKPNEEGELCVRLNTPLLSGRFVSYFRMQTAEGQNFGQRVWSDLVVNLPEEQDAREEDLNDDAEDVPIFEAAAPQSPVSAPAATSPPPPSSELPSPSAATTTLPTVREEEGEEDDDMMSEALQEALLISSASPVVRTPSPSPVVPAPEEKTSEPSAAVNAGTDADWAVVSHDCSDLIDEEEGPRTHPASPRPSTVGGSSLTTSAILRASYENACADVDFEDDEEEEAGEENETIELMLGLMNVSVMSDNSEASEYAAEPTASIEATAPVAASASFVVAMDEQQNAATAAENAELRAWNTEIQMIRAMGFCPEEEDVHETLLPLMHKYVRQPADPSVNRPVNTDGLHSVLSVLLMNNSRTF